MINNFKNQSGFTLIEMLIVIVILGILAMIIIPQITVSTEDAKLSTLQANLSGIRSAVETYYAQHASQYPGSKKILAANENEDTDGATKDAAFIQQLTRYTSSTGVVSNSKVGSYTFGPYLKGAGLPTNPFSGSNNVAVDIATVDITTRDPSGTEDWRFFVNTGVFIANDTTTHAAF